ncbi:ABC transporter substrate-binding protein [Deinococcus kurensis]|uniref:ABC transporter substrate-binding protein n=1 Tax=Deinococcus kurensis TaxID=2662757 RepID=UPI0012D2B88E|nr:ABC transporter substrate-binding protein [Deinococcus kurensis]
MTNTESQTTRRRLLKALAVLSGAALPAAAAQVTPRRAARIAVVLPRRSPYPALAETFMTGLTGSLDGQHVTVSAVQTGPAPRAAAEAARTALRDSPDLLVLLGDGLTRAAQPALLERPTPVLAAEFGVQRPDLHQPAPLALTVSLHSWEAEWAHARTLARHAGVYLLISHLDSGYDLPFAVTSGLQAGRGVLSGTALFDPAAPDHAALVRQVRESGAAHVHVLASGTGAATVGALRRAGFSVSAGGLTAPDLNVPRALAAASTSLLPVQALGFDTGRWISAALTGPLTPSAVHTALACAAVTGTRGTLSVDAHGVLRAPLTLLGAGKPQVLTPPNLLQLEPAGLRSGWLHTYLHA